MPSPLPASQCLDSTLCVVLYRHTYPRDDFKGGFRKAEDLMTLQIGRQVSKSFSHDLNLWDRNLTCGENNRIRYRFDMVDYDLSATIRRAESPCSTAFPIPGCCRACFRSSNTRNCFLSSHGIYRSGGIRFAATRVSMPKAVLPVGSGGSGLRRISRFRSVRGSWVVFPA